MSAIYLVFDPEGLTDAEQRQFGIGAAADTTAYPGKREDLHLSRHFCALASHHGFLPSGGVAAEGGSAVVVAGSCWLDAADERLRSPAELLARWRDRDRDAPPQMVGLFSFACCHQDRRELVVESDFFGSMPLYYRQEGPRVWVASELKFLLRPGRDRPDPAAVAEFMELGFLSRHHTAIAGIRRLPASARLLADRSGLRIEPFPRTVYSRRRALDRDALAEYDGMVGRYLARFRGVADRFSISLSGGLDSRLVAYAARRAGLPFHAFTTGERSSLDTVIARRVAASLDVPIHFHRTDPREMPAWFGKMIWFTEGRVHPGHMHYMSANFHRAVPPGPQLHGLGLEAVLGGHFERPALLDKDGEAIRKACLAATKGLNFWPAYAREKVFAPATGAAIGTLAEQVSEDLFARIGFRGDYADIIEYVFQFKGVNWADTCIISQSLPWADVVDPFFDHHAFQFGATLASADVQDRGGQLRWGMEYFPGFADIPRVKSGALIPVGLGTPDAYARAMARLGREAMLKYNLGRLSRGRITLPMKNSFPQYWQWYPRYRPIRKYVDGILLAERTLDRGFLRREGVRALLHDCRVGRKTWNAVGTLLMVELFLRQFVDGVDRPDDPRVPWGV